MQLNDKRVKVSIERTPRGGIQGYVDTLPGWGFGDGSHVRALFWYDGTIREFRKELAEYVKDSEVWPCDDPDCEHCNPEEGTDE